MNKPFLRPFLILCLTVLLQGPILCLAPEEKDFSPALFYSGLSACESNRVGVSGDIAGGIVSHHLDVSDVIADFFQKLSLSKSPKTIIIIGPNHDEIGAEPVISSSGTWTTPMGEVACDTETLNSLRGRNGIGMNDDVIARDHSVSALIPFVRKYFPSAEVVPILVSSRLDLKGALELGSSLARELDGDTVLVASIDFSHYLSSRAAEGRDLETITAIRQRDYEKISLFTNDNVDSPETLIAFLRAMEEKGAGKIDVIQHTNSGIIMGRETASSTSYFSMFFSKKPDDRTVKLSFCGDIMLSRNIGVAIEKNGPVRVFRECPYIFDGSSLIFGNLESIISSDPFKYKPGMTFKAGEKAIVGLKHAGFGYVSVMNNHRYDYGKTAWENSKKILSANGIIPVGPASLEVCERGGVKIGLLALDMTLDGYNTKSALELVGRASREVDLLVVSVHWGVEYKNRHNIYQEKAAHDLVDAGAGLIIGHHPHSLQDIEVYKGAYIFYSLGNFVFDQYFSEELMRGLAVQVYLKDRAIKYVDLVPTRMYDNTLRIAEPRVRDSALKRLSEFCPEYLRSQVRGGRIYGK